MHISTLYGDYSCGSFGKEAKEFIDFLSDTGFSVWQVLPFGTTDECNSPYKSYSAFGGNPYFVDLNSLYEKGYITYDELNRQKQNTPYSCEYKRLFDERVTLLCDCAQKVPDAEREKIEKFIEENNYLADFCKFMALKSANSDAEWQKWQNFDIDEKILFGWKFIQYEFFNQWQGIKKYANEKNISIIGDIPIYVSQDSCDVWSNRDEFLLDEKGYPTSVAGVPPDYFSKDGQLWGNPLYRWDVHKNTGFEWWIKRLAHCFNMYDVVRIDHFRGLESYWEIPADSETALNGKWVDGPKDEFFEVLIKTFGEEPPIIAEDLGIITDDVRALRDKFGLPGMKILQFAFEDEDSNYLPYNQPYNCVCYTGTHDNDTTTGWYATASEKARDKVRRYMNTDASQVSWDFIRTCFGSPARFAIIPVQDLFCQGSDCRMNTPGKADGNWAYRMKKELLTSDVAKRLYDVTKLYGR